MFSNLTLLEWQIIFKPLEELIVQPSIKDGSDRSEKFDFSIGMGYLYATLSKEKQKEIQIGSHSKLVLCAVNDRTDMRRRGMSNINRKKILEIIKKNGIDNVRLKPDSYYESLGEYKFIISPEGNGIDCHRHYEALLSGCIPIIEDNEDMRRKYKDMPILYTKDYSEITPEYLEKKYEEMLYKEYNFSKLFITNFDENNQKMIKDFGNYWCYRMLKKLYYK